MASGTSYELEIRVTETRELPKIKRGQFLVVQSTYNHELKETSPAVAASRARGERPFWREGNILRWSFTPADLKKLKASTPTVKLNLIAKNRSDGPARDSDTSLGYVLLDIRRIELSLADSVSAFSDWLPLNGSNPGELHACAQMNAVAEAASSIEHEQPTVAGVPEQSGSSFQPLPHKNRFEVPSAEPEVVVAARRAERSTVLISADSDAVRLGSGADLFLLSIDLTGVGNLLPSLGRRTGEYWLSFKLFGDVVQTECFTDTARPRFPPTHDAFRLQGSIAEVKAFLDSQPPVAVYLCSPGVAWGVASLPVHSLCSEVQPTQAEAFGTASVSGAFAVKPLHPPELAASYERSGQPEPGVLQAALHLARETSPPLLQQSGSQATPAAAVALDSAVSAATPAPREPPTPAATPSSVLPGRAPPSHTQPAVPPSANVVVIPPAAVPVSHIPTMPSMTPLQATPASSAAGHSASLAGGPPQSTASSVSGGTRPDQDTFGVDILQVSVAIPRDTSSLLAHSVPAASVPAQPAPGLLDLTPQGGPVWVEVSVGPRVATLTSKLHARMDEVSGSYRVEHGVAPSGGASEASGGAQGPPAEGGSASSRGMHSLSVHSMDASGSAASGATDLLCWFPASVLHEEGGDIVAVRLLTRQEAAEDDVQQPHTHALAEGTVGAAELLSCMPLDLRLYTPGHLDLLEAGALQLPDVTPVGWVSLCGVQSPQGEHSSVPDGTSQRPAMDDQVQDRSAAATTRPSGETRNVRDDVSTDAAERQAQQLRASVRSSYAGLAESSPRTASSNGTAGRGGSRAVRTLRTRQGKSGGKTKHKNTYATDLTSRHFRLSVELRAVKGLSQPANVMARASFAGFSFAVGAADSDADPQNAPVLASTGVGTLDSGRPVMPASTAAAPSIRTAPPVRTAPNTEVLLPNGFRYFEFSSSGAALTQSLQHGGHSALDESSSGDGTLAVAVTHRDVKRFTEDVQLGTAAVPLADVLSSSVFYRCPFTHRTFSTRAGFDKHITGLKAAQKPGAPGAQLGISAAGRSRSRGTGTAKTGAVDWDTPPIALRSLDRYFPVLAWGGSMGRDTQGAGHNGDSEAWGAAGRTGGAPLGDDGDRLQVAGQVRVRVYLEDFGEITQSGEAAANGALLGASVAGMGTSAGAPPGATMRGAGDRSATDGMMKAVEDLLGWEAAALPSGGGMSYGTQGGAVAGGHPQVGTSMHSSGVGNPFHVHMDAVSFHGLPRALQALALRSLQRWREEAEEAWIADLKEKEREKRAEWENAFAEKDAARTAEVAALTKQYRALEAQLKRAITKAERKALHTEAQVAAAQAQLEVDQKQLEHRAERLQEDFRARAAAERGRRDVLGERIAALEAELAREREATARTLREFQEYRAAQVDTPEAVLRDRISALEGERVALTRELGAAKAATKDALDGNATLRAQMYRLARELQRARGRERAAAEADLEKLRVEYLAREERYVLADERSKLRGIRAQLDDLRRNEAELRAVPPAVAPASASSAASSAHGDAPTSPSADSGEDSDGMPDDSHGSESGVLDSSMLSTGSMPAPVAAPAPLPHPSSPALSLGSRGRGRAPASGTA